MKHLYVSLLTICIVSTPLYSGQNLSNEKSNEQNETRKESPHESPMPSSKKQPKVTVHVHNHINQEVTNENKNNNENKNTAQSSTSLFFKQYNIAAWPEHSKQFFVANKKQCALAAIGTLYGTIAASLWYNYRYLEHESRWCKWKHHLTLDEMRAVPHQEIELLLRQEILHRYLRQSNGKLSAYLQFIKDIEYEEVIINRFITLSNAIQKVKLTALFPTNQEKLRLAKRKKKRLSLIKTIFISWAATQGQQF